MKKRLFVAIAISDDLRYQLSHYKKCHQFDGAKWVSPEHFHLTLFFLGSVAETVIPHIVQQLQLIMAKSKPFELTFDKVTFVPEHGAPRLLWAQFGGNENYKHLVRAIQDVLGSLLQLDYSSEQEKESIPHITLARFKRRIKVEGLILEQPEIAPFTVSSCQLISSELLPEGPLYTECATFMFGGR